ncbi:MAG: hypothetical protein ACTSQY_03265 [Candidatus Odinarchaeia archaeon]
MVIQTIWKKILDKLEAVRVLLAAVNVGKVLQAKFVNYEPNFITTNVTWTDITNMSISITTGANDIYITAKCTGTTYTNTTAVKISFKIDDTDMSDKATTTFTHHTDGGRSALVAMWKESVSAGAHTIKLRANGSGGGNKGFENSVMTIYEVKT